MKISLLACLLAVSPALAGEPASTAATAINALGIDLLRKSGAPDANALLSPYSIQSALAMAYAGADGVTREEMAEVLHFPGDEAALHSSFAALRTALGNVVKESSDAAERMKQWGATNDPITLSVANRLFGQSGYDFRESFLGLLKEHYAAPFEPLDFVRNTRGATKHINDWVGEQTQQRIRDVISDGALNESTRLVLVNAIYLKAPWARNFKEPDTKPRPFRVAGGKSVDVLTMTGTRELGYGWTGDRNVQILYRVSEGMLTNGIVSVPSALKAFIQGRFGLMTDDNSKIGTLVVKDNSGWGLGPFFTRRGGEPGDYLSIVFDPSHRVATIQIGDASLADRFRDPNSKVDQTGSPTEFEVVLGSAAPSSTARKADAGC